VLAGHVMAMEPSLRDILRVISRQRSAAMMSVIPFSRNFAPQ